MTDFDECQQGECIGIFQPTVGPDQGMGFETEAYIDLIILNQSDVQALLESFRAMIAELVPGVYLEDVRTELADDDRRRNVN